MCPFYEGCQTQQAKSIPYDIWTERKGLKKKENPSLHVRQNVTSC